MKWITYQQVLKKCGGRDVVPYNKVNDFLPEAIRKFNGKEFVTDDGYSSAKWQNEYTEGLIDFFTSAALGVKKAEAEPDVESDTYAWVDLNPLDIEKTVEHLAANESWWGIGQLKARKDVIELVRKFNPTLADLLELQHGRFYPEKLRPGLFASGHFRPLYGQYIQKVKHAVPNHA